MRLNAAIRQRLVWSGVVRCCLVEYCLARQQGTNSLVEGVLCGEIMTGQEAGDKPVGEGVIMWLVRYCLARRMETNLLVKGDPLGVEDPDGAGLCRAVSGLLLLVLKPPLSLRRSWALLGSDLGVDRPGLPDALRCRPGSGDATLDGICSASIHTSA